MLSELQRRAAQAIVNIFETGRPQGDYGKVTLVKNDAGHLTYGRSQTTLASGNLHLLVKAYCATPDAEFAAPLSEYLGRLENRDTGLDNDMTFRHLLRDAGDDPTMHVVQDQFFDRVYWAPSLKTADAMAITSALGTGVVYDSRIHGSWARVRDINNTRHGLLEDIGEKAWVDNYVSQRREWLVTHSNPALHPTVYRMDAFRRLISASNWDLALPFTVRGIRIDEDVLMAGEPVRVSAHDESERTLLLQTPFMVGSDVEAVQQALVDAGIAVDVDGIYGYLTEAAVRRFQQRKGLKVDGVVGAATRSALDL